MLVQQPQPALPGRVSRRAPAAPRIRTGWSLAAAAAGLAAFVAVAVFALQRATPPTVDTVGSANVLAERVPWLTMLAHTLSNLGSTFGLLIAVIITIGVLRLLTNRWSASIQLATTMALSSSLTTLLKIATARHRPPVHLLLGMPSSSYAFPSGHTLNSTVCFLLTAALFSPYLPALGKAALWLGATVTVVLIGWSRIYLGYHWPTDVLAGWLLGITVVSLSLASAAGFTPLNSAVPTSPDRALTTGSTEG